jgi:hypothetical protein
VKRLRLAGILPSLLLSGLLLAGTQPSPAADKGPTVQMTVTPVR